MNALESQVAVVTGAARGAGEAIARRLASMGAHVLLVCPGPIAREDARPRYEANSPDLPATAMHSAGGAKIKAVRPDELAERILRVCELRRPELIVPARARFLFALAQLSPTLGDWLLRKSMPG